MHMAMLGGQLQAFIQKTGQGLGSSKIQFVRVSQGDNCVCILIAILLDQPPPLIFFWISAWTACIVAIKFDILHYMFTTLHKRIDIVQGHISIEIYKIIYVECILDTFVNCVGIFVNYVQQATNIMHKLTVKVKFQGSNIDHNQLCIQHTLHVCIMQPYVSVYQG